LIKNLLPRINRWKDFENNSVTEITDNTDPANGFGEIIILHTKLGIITIDCKDGHTEMKMHIETDTQTKLLLERYKSELNNMQKGMIYVMLGDTTNINLEDYLNYDFTNRLDEFMRKKNIDTKLKLKIFELSLTNQFDADVRRRIEINVESEFFNEIIKKYGGNEKLNEFTYVSKDFEFVKKIPNMYCLNHIIINQRFIEHVDLSPLSNIRVIGDNFLSGCANLKHIDLASLTKLEKVGSMFLCCTSLE
jgi:hypothetical protein